MNKNHNLRILSSIQEIPANASLAVFGAGETGQEFVQHLKNHRADCKIVCFFDSYRKGVCRDIPIKPPEDLNELEPSTVLIIASIFWNEIASTIIKYTSTIPYYILSNQIIHSASHLSAYGSFYFDEEEVPAIAKRLSALIPYFKTELDKKNLEILFNLRAHRKEPQFFEYMDQLVREQKFSFEGLNKYAQHLDLNSIRYIIEGGVYDGQDSFQLFQALKDKPQFKKIIAFDPFLEPLRKGKYSNLLDSHQCEFIEKVLWNKEEDILFKVDRANPSNSTVLRGKEISPDTPREEICKAISIDAFLKASQIPVDLIKLDVEGSEALVMEGAKESIKQYQPKLAISIYHCKEHFIEIPEFLLSLNPNYQFSISVNNPSFVDMVLYASERAQ